MTVSFKAPWVPRSRVVSGSLLVMSQFRSPSRLSRTSWSTPQMHLQCTLMHHQCIYYRVQRRQYRNINLCVTLRVHALCCRSEVGCAYSVLRTHTSCTSVPNGPSRRYVTFVFRSRLIYLPHESKAITKNLTMWLLRRHIEPVGNRRNSRSDVPSTTM